MSFAIRVLFARVGFAGGKAGGVNVAPVGGVGLVAVDATRGEFVDLVGPFRGQEPTGELEGEVAVIGGGDELSVGFDGVEQFVVVDELQFNERR